MGIKKSFWVAGTLCLLSGAAAAAASHGDEERAQDVTRHRAMAAAHEAAAKCLEAGKPEDVCQAELLKACKGLGIGKYCGMRHLH
jgi:Cdc6-like AAA superfamily ATPase